MHLRLDEHNRKRVIALLAKNSGRKDRSQILRNMPIDAATLKCVLATLMACNMIEDEAIPSGKVVILLKNTLPSHWMMA